MSYGQCVKCRKIMWGIWASVLECPKCHRLMHSLCADRPGVGFIRKGFCPECGRALGIRDLIT